jgi:hypothetical protein
VTVGFKWAPVPKDGDVIDAFKGDVITFPWAYTLSPGEQIASIEWTLDGYTREMVAFYRSGELSLVGPAFSGRMQLSANGNLTLSHVTEGDSGNYTMKINLNQGKSYSHSVVLQVFSECFN